MSTTVPVNMEFLLYVVRLWYIVQLVQFAKQLCLGTSLLKLNSN